MTKKHFDLLIVVPLEEEFQQLQAIFEHKVDLTEDGCFMSEVETDVDGVTAIAVLQEDMGKTAAANAVDQAFERFSFSFVVCVGIAGALSKDIHLCDVCYSSSVIDVYDNTKASDGDGGGIDLALSPTHFPSPKKCSSSFDYVRLLPELKPQYIKWQKECSDFAARKIPDPVYGRDNKKEEVSEPKSLKGVIICGAVSASKKYNEKVKGLDRKVMAIETESGGVFERAQKKGVPAISIRGISDYADSTKGRLEGKTAGAVREVAAKNAMTFLKLQLKAGNFVKCIKEIGGADNSTPDLFEGKEDAPLLPGLVEGVSIQIDEKLREISPEYRLLPKGYKLPLPRIRKVEEEAGSASEDGGAKEIIDCLHLQDRIFISLTKGYPEKSLAWVIADELVQSSIADKQIIPIVVEGSQVKPPAYGIEYAASVDFSKIRKCPAIPVVVFDGVPLHSRSRMNFIVEEISKHSDAKFIFVDRTYSNLFYEGEFAATLGVEAYEICEVSFTQMSHFVQKNFDMESAEAEVVALRLRDTFRRFDLDAHPSYFAGIPRSTLTALIQANRRAELMELAVAGFLIFVVADDKASIQLSRTTRSRFLQSLLVEIWVEKRAFTHAELIDFTSRFAKKYDFDIEPIKFVQDFLENGVLHFEGERVCVTLPFIEHYLLALALSSDEDLARKYFNLGSDFFDISTFDLYAEIGPSEHVVDDVLSTLRSDVAERNQSEENELILLSGELEGKLKFSHKKVSSLKSRVDQAVKSVENGDNQTKDKQQLLDASDEVRRSFSKFQDNVSEGGIEESDREPFVDSVRHWSIATTLLGSGAEHLDASTKRELSSLIVQGLAAIIEDWTRRHDAFDFDGLRETLTSDENIDKFVSQSPGDRSVEEVRKMFDRIIDGLRYVLIGMPFHRVVGHLCESARGPVLAKSVSQCEVSSEYQEMLKSIWLSDIDVQSGKENFDRVVKKFPDAPFFRFLVASHFLTRVYWSHAKKNDRLAVLEMADGMLKSTSINIGKHSLVRMIETDEKEKSKNK
ncbi:hypothetical protein [Aquicoccus sp. SU-CL01552]|uniref:phosphorylase family protein n=1 Tax=Aquicoccus sp. SU-CL01552 TaxID=3127656 RepID=UPI0031069003